MWRPFSSRTNYSVNSHAFVLEATHTISLKRITYEVESFDPKSALLQNNEVWKKFYFLFSYKVTPSLHHPKNNLWANDIQSSHYREKYTKNQCLYPRFSSGAKIFGHVWDSTKLVSLSLACQQFKLISADWISHSLFVISSWFLQTMGNEFIFWSSRH